MDCDVDPGPSDTRKARREQGLGAPETLFPEGDGRPIGEIEEIPTEPRGWSTRSVQRLEIESDSAHFPLRGLCDSRRVTAARRHRRGESFGQRVAPEWNSSDWHVERRPRVADADGTAAVEAKVKNDSGCARAAGAEGQGGVAERDDCGGIKSLEKDLTNLLAVRRGRLWRLGDEHGVVP